MLRSQSQRSQHHCPSLKDACKTFTFFLSRGSSHEIHLSRHCCQSQVTKNRMKLCRQQQGGGGWGRHQKGIMVTPQQVWGEPCLPHSSPFPWSCQKVRNHSQDPQELHPLWLYPLPLGLFSPQSVTLPFSQEACWLRDCVTLIPLSVR